uniref:Uncharacterized protein n=1 Tax=Chelonoidis abingdonii TaxID=106734 RepID=A0A8C0QNV0_CHEAB
IIQSSQPSSLKFTCRGFLLHLSRDFLPCLLPWRLAKAVRLFRRVLNCCWVSCGTRCGEPRSACGEPRSSRSSANRFFRGDLVNTTSSAFSCCARPLRPKPRLLRSGSGCCPRPPGARSSRHSCFQGCCCCSPCHTSNTSQPAGGASCGARVRAPRSRGERQGKSCMEDRPGGGWGRRWPGALRKSRSSAPTSSSLSERVDTSNKYFCLLSGAGERSSAR